MENSQLLRDINRKITLFEITILCMLIALWLGQWFISNKIKIERLDMAHQHKLEILESSSQPDRQPTGHLIIQNGTVIENSRIEIEPFQDMLNTEAVMRMTSELQQGTSWIQQDSLSDKIWISWHERNGLTYAIATPEKELLNEVGFDQIDRWILISTILASLLLLIVLIFSIAWLRLTAIRKLQN